jgi:putative membrane protein
VIGEIGPYAWQLHLFTWLILIVGVAAVIVGHRRIATADPARATPWTRRQIVSFAVGVVAAVVALTWPLADLAAHWSLTALVVQRLLLTLAVPPFLLLGIPYDVLQWLTRPAPVDTALSWFRRPGVAIVVFAVLAVSSMTTGLVDAQSSSALARGLIDVVMVLAGLVLWIPVIGRIPGIQRLRPVGRFTYLVVQAVLPAFLSFIYIFAKHPLYPVFARSHRAIGLRPLTDQQVSGFVSKLSFLFVMLTVGAVVLTRAQRADEEYGEGEPLVWADVERQFERADRQSGPPPGEPSKPVEPRGGPSTPDPGVHEPEGRMDKDEGRE